MAERNGHGRVEMDIKEGLCSFRERHVSLSFSYPADAWFIQRFNDNKPTFSQNVNISRSWGSRQPVTITAYKQEREQKESACVCLVYENMSKLMMHIQLKALLNYK